ncbi:putative lipase [Nordella sp. HKS 07]|uniref:putative lipase n=1 Tax=Nordella sp. HKS 07 TaxID=2712222 RepID=UPI0013E1A518|nr:putative lipase [Nordella sp. HKS 07]QIG49442.1 putative lipase [Nordella sp. HKS 07]
MFVHGLGGDAYGTWRYDKTDGAFWPRGLAEEIPGLGVYSLQYAASASRLRGTVMHLQDRSINVFERLILGPGLKTGPIAFACYSLGGLVAKQLLRHAHDKSQSRDEVLQFLDRVTKVVFLATPHMGSGIASLTDRSACPESMVSGLVS